MDGGHFSTYQKINHTAINMKNLNTLNSPSPGHHYYRTHVPLTIIGEYYLTAEDAAGKSPKPIHSSPYCYPSPKRSHPDLPLRDEVAAHREGLDVVIPQAGHKLVEKVDKSTATKFTVRATRSSIGVSAVCTLHVVASKKDIIFA